MDKGAVVKIIDRFRQEIETRGVIAQKIISVWVPYEWDGRGG